MFDYFFKTIILGNSGVGKSTILSGKNQDIDTTIGIDLITENIIWNANTIKMHIWDTSGNIHYQNILKTYLSSCIGAFIVCNLNDFESFYFVVVKTIKQKIIIKFLRVSFLLASKKAIRIKKCVCV